MWLKATNRAIEKVLRLALFFQAKEEYSVRIRTSSLAVVDDIVPNMRPSRRRGRRKKGPDAEKGQRRQGPTGDGEEERASDEVDGRCCDDDDDDNDDNDDDNDDNDNAEIEENEAESEGGVSIMDGVIHDNGELASDRLGATEENPRKRRKTAQEREGPGEAEDGAGNEEDEIPDTQVRKLSVVEVGIGWKT